jgi:hypothetical protein
MKREWYFVRRIRSYERPGLAERFEIQVLDDEGRARSTAYVSQDAIELTVDGHTIPTAVIEAAKRHGEDQGDYVGPDGRTVSAF